MRRFIEDGRSNHFTCFRRVWFLSMTTGPSFNAGDHVDGATVPVML
jgi:hypothetical protein